jgi:tRNA(Ile)-lysidine synthase
LALPGGGALRLEGADAFDAPVRVRARQGGERIALPGRDHHHALKHVLQDLGVPPWERERLPLLEGAQGDVLAAGDRAVAAPLQAWLEARGARLAWTP